MFGADSGAAATAKLTKNRMDTLCDEDLPAEARELITGTEREVEKLQAACDKSIERIEKKAARDTAKEREKRDEGVRERQQGLAAQLKPLQDSYARDGKLDEALAIRAKIRQLRVGSFGAVEPGPEILSCRPGDVGKSFLFEVTGSSHGSVWGTDVYTTDSSLPKAAVHAGVLKAGERGVVKVTVLDTSDRDRFEGSRRNGVTSEEWDEWDLGFTVARP